MPNKASAIKALRQTKKITLRHNLVKSKIENLEKRIKKLVVDKKKEAALKLNVEWQKACDKAAKTNIFKANTANRMKSRLLKAINSIK